MKDKVQLADVFKAAIQGLNKDLDEVEDAQLALGGVDAEHEVQRRVMPVNDADVGAEGGAALHKVAQRSAPARHDGKHVAHKLLLAVLGHVVVELCQARLPVVVEHDHGFDHCRGAAGGGRGGCAGAGSGR